MARVRIAPSTRRLRRLLFLATSVSGLWVSSSASQQQFVPPQQCVINGGTNTNITQNCIINPVPPPVVLLMPKFEDSATSDGFAHRILARLSSTGDLILLACGKGVKDVDASPWPAGMSIGPDERREGYCIAKRFQNAAAGKWVFTVTTEAADTKFTLRPAIE